MQQYPTQQQYPSQPQYAPQQQVPQYAAIQQGEYRRQSQFDPVAKHHDGTTVAQLYQDEEDRRISTTTSNGRPKPNYRPASLQWWYIGFLICVFLGLGAAVVYADLKLRGSDSTATVDARSLEHDEAWLLYARGLDGEMHRRQDGAAPTTPPAADAQPTDPAGVPVGGETPTPANGEPPVIETPPPEVGRLTSALVEVPTEITETAPATTETFITNTVIVVPGDTTLLSTSTISEIVTLSVDPGSGSAEASTFTFTLQPSSEVVFTSTITEAISSTQALTVVSTKPASTYVRIGVTTVFSTFTINSAGQKIEGPKTKVETVEVGGTVIQSVETVAPTAIVSFGADGLPTTITSTPAPITHVTSVPPTKTVVTNVSRPTSTGDKIIVEATRFELTSTSYFIGKFLPPLVAVILALSVRAIDQTAKLYQPFAALAHPLGATGKDSLNLHFDGWLGFWRPFTMVSKGHPVPLLTSVAVWLSIPLAPLSAEAIGLKIHGHCRKNSIEGCALNLGVSSLEAYVLVGVLLLIALLLVGLLVAVSRRWKTGVFADPWCAAGAAALVRNPDVRSLGAPDFRAVKTAIADKQFTLGWFRNHEGREEYGLVLCDEAGRSLRGARREQEGSDMMVQTAYAEGTRYDGGARMVRRPPVTFVALTFWWRLLFLIYLVALMGLVIYYQLGIKVPEEFRRFVEGQEFGMRFISSALGMVVIMAWDAVYCSVAQIAPYRRMANGPQGASRSVLAKRPTYAVTGIYAGIRERDPLLFGVALMAVLADFLPMVFANVPYDLTQTKDVHIICARISAGLLFIMAVALTASMFVRWPELPVDPRSVAGEMWYVAEARWVDRLEGVAVMTDSERKRRMKEMGGKWYYGLTGSSMGERMGIEMNDMYGTMEYSGGAFR